MARACTVEFLNSINGKRLYWECYFQANKIDTALSQYFGVAQPYVNNGELLKYFLFSNIIPADQPGPFVNSSSLLKQPVYNAAQC